MASDLPPYGSAIHQAIATGDLQQMKALAKKAEEHLKISGDVRAALEVLRIEIAKLEYKGRG